MSAIDRDELVRLVRRLSQGEGLERGESDELLRRLQALTVRRISDFIFWPDRAMTAEEIVDRALRERAEIDAGRRTPPAHGPPSPESVAQFKEFIARRTDELRREAERARRNHGSNT